MGEVSFLDVSKRFTLRVDGELHHVHIFAVAKPQLVHAAGVCARAIKK